MGGEGGRGSRSQGEEARVKEAGDDSLGSKQLHTEGKSCVAARESLRFCLSFPAH